MFAYMNNLTYLFEYFKSESYKNTKKKPFPTGIPRLSGYGICIFPFFRLPPVFCGRILPPAGVQYLPKEV